MQCPYCGEDSRVLDSRRSGSDVRRRRECSDCTRRFTTYEQVAPPEIKVQKRDGSLQDFSRSKLVRVVERTAVGRLFQPSTLDGLVSGLEAGLVDAGAKVIASWQLAQRLAARLQELDPVAADRFVSNYRQQDGSVRFQPVENSPQLPLPIVADEPLVKGTADPPQKRHVTRARRPKQA